MAKFCTSCGMKLADDAVFCKNCGKNKSIFKMCLNLKQLKQILHHNLTQ